MSPLCLFAVPARLPFFPLRPLLYTSAIDSTTRNLYSFPNFYFFSATSIARTSSHLSFSRFPPITLMKGRHSMIELTRLNGHPLIINAELIKFVEQNPDTVITLVTGDKMVVREPASEVMRRTLDYRRNLLYPVARPTCPDPAQPESEPPSQE